MKRIFTWVLILAALALIGFVVYTFRNNKTEEALPWKCISEEASLIIDIQDSKSAMEYLNSVETIWKEVLISYKKGLASATINSPSFLFTVNDANTVFTFIVPAVGLSGENISNDIQYILDAKVKDMIDFKGEVIYATSTSFGCIHENCLVISNKQSVIEQLIARTDNEESATLPVERIAERTHADAPVTFYAKWNANEWMQIEPHTSDEAQWYYTGIVFTSDESQTRFQSTINANSKRIGDFLPGGTLSAEVWTFDTFDQLTQNHNQLVKNQDELKYWEAAWKDAGDSCACDINEAMLNWRGGMQGTLLYALEDIEVPVAFVDVIDSISISEFIPTVAEPLADGIYTFKYPHVAGRYMNTPILVEPLYVVQAGQAAYFSSSPDALRFIKMDIDNNNTLQRSDNINEWIDQDLAFVHYYGGSYLSALFPSSLQWLISRSDMNGGNISFQSHNTYVFDWYEGKGTKKPNERSVETSEIITGEEIMLPPVAETNIWSVKNHNTGELETFTQLQDNSIVLKDANGKVLWQAALPDQIVGDVVQIDVYKNEKLQMAFTTKRAIYIIDRNGKSISNFPVKLRSDVTTGLSVLDYENDKNYRLIVGTANGDVLNYSTNGKSTPGWKYKAGAVAKKITYNRDGNKDQLIITFQSGEERTFKRNGTRY